MIKQVILNLLSNATKFTPEDGNIEVTADVEADGSFIFVVKDSGIGIAENDIYVAFPIAHTDTGDYLVRNLMGIDLERGWISVGEMIEAGRSLMFCRRDHAAAEQDLRRMLADLKARAEGSAKAAVYYSCVARGPNLFGPDSEELKMIRDELGDIPLVGFFANGEISNNRLYGYTGVLALFL